MKKAVVLIVLDGWGIGRQDESNPIYTSKPENFLFLEKNFPLGSLQASGISVGLPWGEVGNSEVGHLTLGAGKVIYQYFPRITLSIREGSFFQNQALKGAFEHARKNNSAVNLLGLLTKGNVHASLEHLQALLKMAGEEKITRINLHLFSDGKDSPPHSLAELLKQIPREKLASLTGRYYAMDRQENWNLTERTYSVIVGNETATTDIEKIINQNYQRGLTEEFLPPMLVDANKTIQDNDAAVFFNFREDSIRQLAEAFALPDFDKFPVKKFKNIYLATMTQYEEKLRLPVAFLPEKVEKPLGWVLSENGKTQLRLAETYKYAHVTYFFNGYREAPFKNEYRVLIPSLPMVHPEEHPEMMAVPITDRLIQAIENRSFDFTLVNYANPDTIGHTGNFQAAMETVKIIDREIGRLLKICLNSKDIAVLITSDHGNLEEILNPVTGLAESQHDPNPVPFYLVAAEFKGRKFANWQNPALKVTGILSDVAPTILELMNISQPPEMDGKSLLKELI